MTSLALSDIDVAVLAGGLGTRVAHCLGDLPKIMAPFGDRPFLDVLLAWLRDQGIRRVVLCLGHRASAVLAHLQRAPRSDIEVVCSVEPEPLGTAGALALARPLLRSDPVLVMNGDTLAAVDLTAFLAAFRAARPRMAVVCAAAAEAGRYGDMEIDGNSRVVRFREKPDEKKLTHWVSAGIYCLDRAVLDEIAAMRRGSLEHDVLERQPAGAILAFRAAGSFLDIGTPQALAVARGAGFDAP